MTSGSPGTHGGRPFRVLSVDGGGYLGLASASFLCSLERHFGARAADRFDLFCGTSTGAIIALALAAGKSASEVATLYEDLGRRVFWNPWRTVHRLRKVRGLFAARYGNAGLVAALKDAFGDASLHDLRLRNKLALVTAFNVSTGRPRLFKTDHSERLTTDSGYLLRDVALASAAAPTYLPMVTLRSPSSGIEERFCDGGTFANHPALLGYVEAVSELNQPAAQVSVLSLSTPRFSTAEHSASQSWFAQLSVFNRLLLMRGVLLWGSKLATIFIDAPAEASHQALSRLARVGGGRYERIALTAVSGLEMDLATPEVTNTLKVIGTAEANNNDVRDRVRPFFVG